MSVPAARTCLTLGSALLMSGCSVLLVSRPPPGDGPLPEGTCSTSAAAPVLDASMGALWGLAIVGLMTEGLDLDLDLVQFSEVDHAARVPARRTSVGSLSSATADDVGIIGLLAFPMAGFGYSAYKGFNWASECRRRQALSEEAIADHLRALARNAGAPADF